MATENTFEKLSLLYEENAKVAAIFWEWRHKVMTYFFTGIGALFVVAGWLYQEPKLERVASAPLFLGVLLSIVSVILDRRNGQILQRCYSVGQTLEIEILKDEILNEKRGIYICLYEFRQKRVTYTTTLCITYILVGVILLILAGWALALQR